jgi:hypothetical protein
MLELDLNTATIVTRHEEGRIATESGDIHILPAWHFLLQETN